MTEDDDDDQDLIARITLQDQDAFIALYTRYRPKVRRYLWYHLGEQHELVEEAIQDVFLAIWRGAATYRGEARVLTWIFRITYRCMQHMRQATFRHNHNRVIDASVLGELEPVTTPESQIIERIIIADALQHLSEKHREVLELIFAFGFSQEEVARILAIPVGTVKSRVSYARRALRQELGHPTQEESPSCQT